MSKYITFHTFRLMHFLISDEICISYVREVLLFLIFYFLLYEIINYLKNESFENNSFLKKKFERNLLQIIIKN